MGEHGAELERPRTRGLVGAGGLPFDDAFERAIRSAQPFPSIPASIGQDVLPVSIDFTYAPQGVPPSWSQ